MRTYTAKITEEQRNTLADALALAARTWESQEAQEAAEELHDLVSNLKVTR